MRSYRLYYLIVGAFVLVTLAAFIVSVALLSGRGGAADPYYTVFDNVAGLKFGTLVTYEGYPVGQIARVHPVDEGGRRRFRVDLDVQKGWTIPEGSEVRIATAGLLAAPTLDIHAGEGPNNIAVGASIPGRAGTDMVAAMGDLAGDMQQIIRGQLRVLLDGLIQTISSVNAMVGGDGKLILRELAERAPAIASNLDRVAHDLSATLAGVRQAIGSDSGQRLESTMVNIERASGDFAKLAKDLNVTRSELDRLLKESEGTVRDARPDVAQSARKMRDILESTGRHIDAINHNLEGASRNMFEFSRQIRENPGILLGGKTPSDDIEAGGKGDGK